MANRPTNTTLPTLETTFRESEARYAKTDNKSPRKMDIVAARAVPSISTGFESIPGRLESERNTGEKIIKRAHNAKKNFVCRVLAWKYNMSNKKNEKVK